MKFSEGGLEALVGQKGHEGKLRQAEFPQPRAIFPVLGADGVGEIDEDEFVCEPCGE